MESGCQIWSSITDVFSMARRIEMKANVQTQKAVIATFTPVRCIRNDLTTGTIYLAATTGQKSQDEMVWTPLFQP